VDVGRIPEHAMRHWVRVVTVRTVGVATIHPRPHHPRGKVEAAHRVPPQLLGLASTGTTGFGSVIPVAQVFAVNKLQPLRTRFQQLNEWMAGAGNCEDASDSEPFV